jgi:hypothetical protein
MTAIDDEPNADDGDPAALPPPDPHTALMVNGYWPLLVHDWDTALYVLAVPCTLLPNGRLCQLAGCVFQLKLQPPHCGYWQLGQ